MSLCNSGHRGFSLDVIHILLCRVHHRGHDTTASCKERIAGCCYVKSMDLEKQACVTGALAINFPLITTINLQQTFLLILHCHMIVTRQNDRQIDAAWLAIHVCKKSKVLKRKWFMFFWKRFSLSIMSWFPVYFCERPCFILKGVIDLSFSRYCKYG